MKRRHFLSICISRHLKIYINSSEKNSTTSSEKISDNLLNNLPSKYPHIRNEPETTSGNKAKLQTETKVQNNKSS